jgi:N,N'-diacetyllegionaminate synthase
LSTPFDLKSINFLKSLKMKYFKIPSGEITNLPYLIKIAKLNKKIILSTGMANLTEVGKALDILTSNGTKKKNITVLQCNTEYPTPLRDANIKAMLSIKKIFKVNVGYSDHTEGIETSLGAVALGAKIIEKHITLSKRLSGPDHKASVSPEELKKLVQGIRKITIALGDGIKKPSQSEKKNIKIVRTSIVAAQKIKKGEKFTSKNLTIKRPGNGISPMKLFKVIGKISKKNYSEDELIKL